MAKKKEPVSAAQLTLFAASVAAEVAEATRPTQPAPVAVPVVLAPVVVTPPPAGDVPDLLPKYVKLMEAKNFNRDHMRHVVQYCRYCERWLGMPLASMTKPDMRRYDEHLIERRVSGVNVPATIGKYIDAVHGFFKWAVSSDHLLVVVSDGTLNKPKVGTRLPRSLKAHELLALLEAAGRGVYPDRPLYARRDQALIATLAMCGLRITEALNLDWAHIAGGYLTVIGKGNKERRVPVPVALGPLLDAWKAEHPLGGQGAIFTNAKKPYKRLPYDSDWRKHIKLIIALAGLQGTVSSHWLRHTYAQRLLDSEKVPLDQIQKLLGHSSIATTQTYAKTRVTDSTVAAINATWGGA